jgi:hypothetical protein
MSYTWSMQTETSSTATVGYVTLEEVLRLARQLRPVDQARLIARLAPLMAEALDRTEEHPIPASCEPLYGLLADLGPAPSAEEIDEVRREMWSGFGAD